MKLLLDTNILIWSLNESQDLPLKARQLMVSADEVYVSAINIWEIVIKKAIGKLQMDIDKEDLLSIINDSGFRMLNIKPEHALALFDLEDYHKDPFDRMLIAQSIVEPLHLVTSDSTIVNYNANIIKV